MKTDIVVQTGDSEIQDACACLKNITSIPNGSIPLSRGLGLDWSSLSDNPGEFENDYAVDLVSQVQKYEPRLNIKKVELTHNDEGESNAIITVEGGDE